MQLQQTVIKKYIELFPDQTLRKISEQTGIQQTRVFRILNGQEMKLAEYEKFREAIVSKGIPASFEFNTNIISSLKKLSGQQLESLSREIQYMIGINELKGSSELFSKAF